MSVRDRLVSTGVDLLERQGLAALSLRMIAREAGVSHGAPRRYFPTYGALLAAVARRGIDDLDRRLTPALAGPDPSGAVRAAAESYIDFALTRPEMFELILRHDLLAGAGGDLRTVTGRWFGALADALARLRGRSIAAEEVLAMWSGVHGLATLLSRGAPEAIGAFDRGRTLDLLLGALLVDSAADVG